MHRSPALIGVLACLLLSACGGMARLTKATSQRWFPGVEGANAGKNYVLTYEKPAGMELRIDRVWVGSREQGWLPRFAILPQPTDSSDRHVAAKGITEFTLKFTETIPGQPRRGEMAPVAVVTYDSPPADLPADFSGGVVVWYEAGKQKGTWIVSEFEELQPLYFP